MTIKKLKKELGISNADIAELFDLSKNSYQNSSAKQRYENALCKFYAFVKSRHSFNIMEWKIVEKEGLPKQQKYYLVQFIKNEEWFEMLDYYPDKKYFISNRTDVIKPFTNVYAWCEVNCA